MRSMAATLARLALATPWLIPAGVGAQSGAASTTLTPDEAEAYQMSLTLAGSCSPPRHRKMTDSESTIQRSSDQLTGTASVVRGVEGTFLVLEKYDEDLEGHCLVLGWFGGPLAPGRYAIHELLGTTVEADVNADPHSFFSMFAIRSSAESSLLVVESGTVDLSTVEPGKVAGTFDLSGFSVQESTRGDDGSLQGSFDALEES
jgi:hypothetical protein